MKDLFDLVECHQPAPPEFIDAPPIARNTDPETSHLAAARITRSGDRAAHMALMLAAVIANPGRTSGELAFISGLERHEASRRLSDLHDKAKVYRQGKRKCERMGTMQMCWYETTKGTP